MSLPTRTFSIPTKTDSPHLSIRIVEPSLRADNLTLTTWGASSVLAKLLHTFDISQASSTGSRFDVLELGAGTGLVGLAAAAVWDVENVVLTDLAPIVPGLAMNIDLNREVLRDRKVRIECGALDWDVPETLVLRRKSAEEEEAVVVRCDQESSKARIVVAADTVYSEEHPRMLSGVVAKWLRRTEDARLLIMYPLRVAYLDIIRELWESLEGCGLVAVQEGKDEVEGDWDDEKLQEWSIWKWRNDEDK